MGIVSMTGWLFTGVGTFLSAFYLLRNKFKNDGYLFLYLALLLVTYELFYKTLIHSQLIYEFSFLYVPGRFYNLLIYPVFLLFIWSLTRAPFQPKRWHFLLLILFVAYTLYNFGESLGIPLAEKKQVLDLFYEDKRPGPYNYWRNGATFIQSTFIPVSFMLIIGYEFFQFRRQLTGLQNKRLLHFISLLIVLYFLFNQFANVIYRLAYGWLGYSMIEWPVDILFLSAVTLLLSLVTLSVNSGDTFFPPAKYAASALDKQEYATLIAQAKTVLESEQLYKREAFRLADLANRLSTNVKYLSQAINDHLGLSFVDFVNQYRVEEVKRLLLDEQYKSLTIEAIGNQAGFRSKSSFFKAFKKFTGLTPNQYLKSVKALRK